jgi:hypothetical protein
MVMPRGTSYKMANIGSEFDRRRVAAIYMSSMTIFESSQKSSFGIIDSTPRLSATPAAIARAQQTIAPCETRLTN